MLPPHNKKPPCGAAFFMAQRGGGAHAACGIVSPNW